MNEKERSGTDTNNDDITRGYNEREREVEQ